MKTLTVRLPEELAAELEAEAERRGLSKSDIVRERLERARPEPPPSLPPSLASIADLIGSVEGLPEDLSSRKKAYLRDWSYGRKRRG